MPCRALTHSTNRASLPRQRHFLIDATLWFIVGLALTSSIPPLHSSYPSNMPQPPRYATRFPPLRLVQPPPSDRSSSPVSLFARAGVGQPLTIWEISRGAFC